MSSSGSSNARCPPARPRADRVRFAFPGRVTDTLTNMNSDQSGRLRRGGPPRIEGTKSREILAAATERFGRDGYEDTKWADIAADVGVGPTALYHYFESKQHCLYVIMDQALEGFRARFEALTGDGAAGPVDALVAVIDDTFRLSEHDVQRNRVLV